MSKDDGNKDSREFDQKSQYLYNRKFLLLGHKWLLAFVGIGTDPCFFPWKKKMENHSCFFFILQWIWYFYLVIYEQWTSMKKIEKNCVKTEKWEQKWLNWSSRKNWWPLKTVNNLISKWMPYVNQFQTIPWISLEHPFINYVLGKVKTNEWMINCCIIRL